MNEYEFLQGADKAAMSQKWMDFSPLGIKLGLSPHPSTQIHLN